MANVCHTYAAAKERLENQGIHTVSVDEKSGMQALERAAPDQPMRPGSPAKLEHKYDRHGTQCLIANLEVATGEIVAPTRTESDFAEHIERTVATDPEAGWIFVCDNLNVHCSTTLVILIAMLCKIPIGELGGEG